MSYNYPYQYQYGGYGQYQGYPPQQNNPNTKTNYDMTWQHDMDEFERFLKETEIKKNRKRSRERTRSRSRSSERSSRRKRSFNDISPDRFSEKSSDSHTERLLRESSRLLQQGAGRSPSNSPDRVYDRHDKGYDRRGSPDRGYGRQRSTDTGYGKHALDSPGRGYERRGSPDRGYGRRESLDRGYERHDSPDRGFGRRAHDSPDRGYGKRDSPGRRYEKPDHPVRGVGRSYSPGYGRQSGEKERLTRWSSPDRGYEQPPRQSGEKERRTRWSSPDRGYEQPPRQSGEKERLTRWSSPDRGYEQPPGRSRFSPSDGRANRRALSPGRGYPMGRSPSPVIDTLSEINRLERELEMSSRSKILPISPVDIPLTRDVNNRSPPLGRLPIASPMLYRGPSGAILKEDGTAGKKEQRERNRWGNNRNIQNLRKGKQSKKESSVEKHIRKELDKMIDSKKKGKSKSPSRSNVDRSRSAKDRSVSRGRSRKRKSRSSSVSRKSSADKNMDKKKPKVEDRSKDEKVDSKTKTKAQDDKKSSEKKRGESDKSKNQIKNKDKDDKTGNEKKQGKSDKSEKQKKDQTKDDKTGNGKKQGESDKSEKQKKDQTKDDKTGNGKKQGESDKSKCQIKSSDHKNESKPDTSKGMEQKSEKNEKKEKEQKVGTDGKKNEGTEIKELIVVRKEDLAKITEERIPKDLDTARTEEESQDIEVKLKKNDTSETKEPGDAGVKEGNTTKNVETRKIVEVTSKKEASSVENVECSATTDKTSEKPKSEKKDTTTDESATSSESPNKKASLVGYKIPKLSQSPVKSDTPSKNVNTETVESPRTTRSNSKKELDEKPAQSPRATRSSSKLGQGSKAVQSPRTTRSSLKQGQDDKTVQSPRSTRSSSKKIEADKTEEKSPASKKTEEKSPASYDVSKSGSSDKIKQESPNKDTLKSDDTSSSDSKKSSAIVVHIVEGKPLKHETGSSNSEEADRETREFLAKLLFKSQGLTEEGMQSADEQKKEKLSEQIQDGEKIQETHENKDKIKSELENVDKSQTKNLNKDNKQEDKDKSESMWDVKDKVEKVQESKGKGETKQENKSEGVVESSKSDRLAQLLKMSQDIEEEIRKLRGEETSKKESEKEKSTGKETDVKEEKIDTKDITGENEEQKGNNGVVQENEKKQKMDKSAQDSKKSESVSPEKDDFSTDDLDKIDLSSIQTKTLLSKLLMQSKMLEQQLEALSGENKKDVVKEAKEEKKVEVIKPETDKKDNVTSNKDEKVSKTNTGTSDTVKSSEQKKSVSNPVSSKSVPTSSSSSTSSRSKPANATLSASSSSSGGSKPVYASSLSSLRRDPGSAVSSASGSNIKSQASKPTGKQGVQGVAKNVTAGKFQPRVQTQPVQQQNPKNQTFIQNQNIRQQNPTMVGQSVPYRPPSMQLTVVHAPIRQPPATSIRPSVVPRQYAPQPLMSVNPNLRHPNPVVVQQSSLGKQFVAPTAQIPIAPRMPSVSMNLPALPLHKQAPPLQQQAPPLHQQAAPLQQQKTSIQQQAAPQYSSASDAYSSPRLETESVENSQQQGSADLLAKIQMETQSKNSKHQTGRNLQNIVSIPQADKNALIRQSNKKTTGYTKKPFELKCRVISGPDATKLNQNVFPETENRLHSSLLSNIKDSEQQKYIQSLWGDGGIGQIEPSEPLAGGSSQGIGNTFSSEDVTDSTATLSKDYHHGHAKPVTEGQSSQARTNKLVGKGHKAPKGDHRPGVPYANVVCIKCKQHGHKMRHCLIQKTSKAVEKRVCFECGDKGHLAKDCPWIRCFNCGGVGHKGKDCTMFDYEEELEDLWCHHCGQDGHLESECPKKANAGSNSAPDKTLSYMYKANELKRLKEHLMFRSIKQGADPIDVIAESARHINFGLKSTFETSVVTRVENIELLSAAINMSGGIFLARIFGYNRHSLRVRAWEKSLEVLLSKSVDEILSEEDPGPHGYQISKEIYDDVCEKAAQDKECQKFLLRVATHPETKDEFFIQKIEELRRENKISRNTVIAALRERHKLLYEKMNTATIAEILSNPEVESNATDLFQVGKNPHQSWKVVDKFVIMEKELISEVRKTHAFDILYDSAYRNGMLLQWWNRCIYTKAPNIHKCNIWLQNQPIGEAYTISKTEAKKLAAADALSNLYKRLPAIKISELKNQKTKLWVMYREVFQKAEALRMANVTPLPLTTNTNVNRWVIQVCHEIILDYLNRTTLESLEFKPGFSEGEIAELKTLSSAKGLNYQLRKDLTGITVVIDKEIQPLEILTMLRQSGGVSGAYAVIPEFECENIGKQLEIGSSLMVRDLEDD